MVKWQLSTDGGANYSNLANAAPYVTLSLDTKSIELEDELFGDNVIDDYESQFDDEGDYKGKPVLIIKLEN